MSTTRGDFWLGPVLVEPDRLRLSRDGRVVILQPRVMDLLVALASGGGAVVSRQELEAQVWTDAHVGYHALPRAVYEARKALEELSPGEVYLETIPRRGYSLKVVPIPAVAQNCSEPSLPSRNLNPRPELWRRLPIAALGLLALGLIMHAASLHGSGVHLVCAASILGWTIWPSVRRSADAT